MKNVLIAIAVMLFTVLGANAQNVPLHAVKKTQTTTHAAVKPKVRRTELNGFEIGATWAELKPRLIEKANEYFATLSDDDAKFLNERFEESLQAVDQNGEGMVGLARTYVFTFDEGILAEAYATFHEDEVVTYTYMLEQATKKYGKPPLQTKKVLQNGMGARWLIHEAAWDKTPDSVLVYLRQEINDGDHCISITLYSAKKWAEYVKREEANKPKL